MERSSMVFLVLCTILVFTTKNVFSHEYDFQGFQNSYNPYNNPYENWHNNDFFNNNGVGNERFVWPSYPYIGHNFRDSDEVERTIPVSSPREREPLDVDFISGTIGNPDDTQFEIRQKPIFPSPNYGHDVSHVFQHTFGDVLGPNAFGGNGFGTIGFGSNGFGPGFEGFFPGFPGFTGASPPWWKGANVCTERKEEIEDGADKSEEKDVENIDGHIKSGFLLNIESCYEKQNKHVCRTASHHQGRLRTVTVTKQCCHGFARINNGVVNSQCEQFELNTVPETATKLGAKEFIRSAKNNGLEEKLLTNITIFAPIDSAFTDFTENMFESNLVVLPLKRSRREIKKREATSYTNKDLILNHIVENWINIEDIENEQILQTAYENATIRINIFPRPPNDDNNFQYPYRFTANCAPITKVNKISSNGIVHVIEHVLTPVTKTILEILKERRDMTVLKMVLEKTNLEKMLGDNGKTFTIFAPTDRAFEKLDPQLKRSIKEGNGCAINIIKNHILDLTFCSSAVIAEARTNTLNILGQRLNFEKSDNKNSDESAGNEISDLVGLKDIIINGESRISETDLMATNGVVHVIDSLIPTESGMPITSLLEKRNLTIFKQLIQAANIEDEFDGLSNASFFAPTDKAFEGNHWKMELEQNPNRLKNNKDLQTFLKYHIIKPLLKTCDFTETTLNTISDDKLRVNLYTTHPIFTNIMNRATINCARIIHFDDESCGSVLHQVDKVLKAPTNNILQQLDSNENYSMFMRLIREANLTSLLEDMDQDLTVFVPKNDVFREVNEWYSEILENKNELTKVIKSHIIPDVLCCAGIVPSDWPFIRTVETINNIHLKLDRDRRPIVQNAGVTKCDIITKNGVIHEINDVITVRQKPVQPQQEIDRFW